ncbi:MAG TPA: radical SAM protein, partial [Acidimicrobiales bacterium]
MESALPRLDGFRVALVWIGSSEVDGLQPPILNPPLGIQLLGTLLRRQGAQVELFDNRVSREQLAAEIVAFGPQLCGFSFLSTAAHLVTPVAQAVRDAGIVTVAGGVHATVRAGELLATGAYDSVVTGDGERALVDLCARRQGGHSLPEQVAGTPWRVLDELPAIDRFDVYADVYGGPDRIRTVSIQISRGCPMNCQFCELARDAGTYALPTAYIGRSPAVVEHELTGYLDRWDATWVVVVDSIATLAHDALCAALRVVGERPATAIQFNAHVNRFQPAVADALRPLGDRATVWFGFESGSDAMLTRLHKAHTAGRALTVGRSALASGAKVGANLLLGVPGETSEDRAATRAFVAELVASGVPDQVLPNPNIFNPLPGTPLYAACLADGSIAGDDYR